MKIQHFEVENYQAKADFIFDENEINQFYNKAYQDILPQIQIPGFRKGKAPLDIAKKYVNDEVVIKDVLEAMISKSLYFLAQEKDEYEFISPPKLNSEDIPLENNPYTLKLIVEFFPEIDLSKVDQIEVALKPPKDKKEFEQEIIQSLLETNATFLDIESEPTEGNYALIEYSYDTNQENQKMQPTLIEIGKNQLMPNSDEVIKKMKQGQEEVITYSPEDKEETYAMKVRLLGFKEKKLPELNEEFLKTINIDKTYDEYLAEVSMKAEHLKKEEDENAKWDAFFETWFKDHLIENLPENILQHYLEQAIEIFEDDLKKSKLTLDEFLAKTDKTMDEVKDHLKPRAVVRANIDLLIRAILKNNPELNPKEETINEETQQYLGKYKDVTLDKDKVRNVVEMMLRRKNALNWLMEKVNFISKE